jgi:hypothetical protein
MAAMAMVLSSSLVAFASVKVPLVRVSTDPYTNANSMHQTELEPDTFAYGSTIVGAFQVGRFTDGGASNIGWATTTNNGTTWTNGFLPGITVNASPPGVYQRVSDPSVAYDAMHGVWMVLSLPLNGPGAGLNTVVSRSTNGGTTWQNPVTVVTQGGLDKTWIACDNSANSPFYGHCYAEWDYTNAGNLIQMSTSTDGGLTWGVPRATGNAASGLGGQPVVQPNGKVIVPISANNSAVIAFNSTDGGLTWSSSTTISTSPTHSVAGNLRTSPLPSAEIDPQGRVYVVWQDCRFRTGCSSNDIVMSTSLDGVTWSAVTRIPIDPVTSTVDHFIPGIAVNTMRSGPPAQLGLTYYYYPVASCTSATCQLNVGFVSSLDGGASWSAPVAVAGPMTLTWLPLTNQGYMVGDYISTSISSDGKAHTIFSVATAPSGGTFDEAMFAPVAGLSLELHKGDVRVKAGEDRPVPDAHSDHPLDTKYPTAH